MVSARSGLSFVYTNTPRICKNSSIPSHATRVVDMAPRDRWDFDVLTPKGEQKFRDVIKRMCEKDGTRCFVNDYKGNSLDHHDVFFENG